MSDERTHMNVAYVRLLSARREDLWRGPGASPQDLRRLREKRGEKIAAVDPETERLLGWISLYPEKDAGGVFFALAGHRSPSRVALHGDRHRAR